VKASYIDLKICRFQNYFNIKHVHELEYACACEQRRGKITVLTGLEIYTQFNNSGMFVSISMIMLKTMRLLQNAY
jgi:hypothetical protein